MTPLGQLTRQRQSAAAELSPPTIPANNRQAKKPAGQPGRRDIGLGGCDRIRRLTLLTPGCRPLVPDCGLAIPRPPSLRPDPCFSSANHGCFITGHATASGNLAEAGEQV